MAFNGVERQVFHPTLVNVVQHRDAETFQIRMLVDICFERLRLDVFLGLGLPVIAFGKTDRPPLSPKRRPVVYKTNLTNRQQKELLSVQGQRYQDLSNIQNFFVIF